MRIDDIYSPSDEPSAFAFVVVFDNPCNASHVDVFVPDASSQVQSVGGRISVLITVLASSTEELQSMVQNAVLSCDGREYYGRDLCPVLTAGIIEVPSGFHGCKYHALHTTYPDFFRA
ncbi:hypothetical protein [Terasakiella sp.]|uniref:hypothetical protein n=1 Tax=Terasakiella sp. TaxID=2034861 RepID=UPI003AA95C19